MSQGKHYARVDCVECDRFLRWLPKPEADRAKRPNSHRDLVSRFSRGYCELCGISQADLPKNETLEGHHVDEFQAGGEPTRENVWILCSACHSLVNWRRTYVGHLLSLAGKLTKWRDQ
jgi:5-methylcytosine-specific restriction endonuclease McrA